MLWCLRTTLQCTMYQCKVFATALLSNIDLYKSSSDITSHCTTVSSFLVDIHIIFTKCRDETFSEGMATCLGKYFIVTCYSVVWAGRWEWASTSPPTKYSNLTFYKNHTRRRHWYGQLHYRLISLGWKEFHIYLIKLDDNISQSVKCPETGPVVTTGNLGVDKCR